MRRGSRRSLLLLVVATAAGCAGASSPEPGACSSALDRAQEIPRGCDEEPYLDGIADAVDAALHRMSIDASDYATLRFRFDEHGIAETCVETSSSKRLARKLDYVMYMLQRDHVEPPPACVVGARYAVTVGASPAYVRAYCEVVDQEGARRPILRVPLEYPAAAIHLRQNGYVILQLVVASDGQVAEAVVVEASPPGIFDQAALAATNRWRFCPEEPGRIEYPQPLEFLLRFEMH